MADDPNLTIPEDAPASEDAPATGDQPGGETPPTGDTKIAGKFADEDAFNAGFNEIAATLDVAGVVKTEFDTIEDKVAAYKKMETMLHNRKKPDDAPSDNNPDALTVPDEPTVEDLDSLSGSQILEKAGVDQNEFVKHFTENGSVSADHVKAIKKLIPGIPAALINQYAVAEKTIVELQAVEIQRLVTKAQDLAGGPDQLKNLMNFAATLSPNVKANLQTRLHDPEQFEDAIIELQRKQANQNGHSTDRNTETNTSPPREGGLAPFSSNREYVQAKSDPRYGVDVAYTNSVLKRVEATPERVFGTHS